MVCNFTKPTAETPSLLTFQEVTTLFHEFGHALHGILANTQYPNLSGTSVKWDFVELLQFLENYCYEPEFLKTFAKHYQTGEILPDEKIQKILILKTYGRLPNFETTWFWNFGYDLSHESRRIGELMSKNFEDETTEGNSIVS